MMKRKSELRSSTALMSVHKYKLKELRKQCAEYLGIQNVQVFFPSIEKLFKTENLKNISEYGLKLDEEVVSFTSGSTIRTSLGNEVEVHKKITMILSVYKYMKGEYGSLLNLPTSSHISHEITNKIQNPNNASYVGAIISAALSGCQHFPKVYGLFNGIAEQHTVDISDDYGDICERGWFSKNIGNLFEIRLSDVVQSYMDDFKHTRSARVPLELGDSVELADIPELETFQVEDVTMADMSHVLGNETLDSDQCSEISSSSSDDVFEIESCGCDSDDSSVSSDDETSEPFAWVKFKDVPVQVTLMEKCKGTLYELMMINTEEEKHLAWIAQVIFALAYAQRNFGFTHNDLHANNIMYVPCEEEYLYYNVNGQLYKVPTYGCLIKIIDFERAIATIKLKGMKEAKVFMSDHYQLDEEAGGMFNYSHYYTPKHPEIKPNPSADLVRLATSLYWDFYTENSDSRLASMFKRWMSIESGSILFGKKNPIHERYHGFELYKAIIRYCKDTAVPRKEISLLTDIYGVQSVEGNVLVIE